MRILFLIYIALFSISSYAETAYSWEWENGQCQGSAPAKKFSVFGSAEEFQATVRDVTGWYNTGCNQVPTFSYPSPGTVTITWDWGGVGNATAQVISCDPPEFPDKKTKACATGCYGDQTPENSSCKRDPKRIPVDCPNGVVVYVPQQCPIVPTDYIYCKTPGQAKTCPSGRVVVCPMNCLDGNVSDFFSSPGGLLAGVVASVGAGAAAGGIPGAVAGGLAGGVRALVKGSNGSITRVSSSSNSGFAKLTEPMALKNPLTGELVYANVDVAVPAQTIGEAAYRALQTVDSPRASAILSEFTGLNGELTARVVNGELMPLESDIAYTSGEVGRRLISSANFDFSNIVDYVHPSDVPWYDNATDYIEADYYRVTSGQQPINIPYFDTGLTPSSSYEPIVYLTPQTTFKPIPTKHAATSPTTDPVVYTNTNPDGSTKTTNATGPQPNTYDSTATTIPEAPTVYPDTWKYFDFLKTNNPFSFDPTKFMPLLPADGGCTYAIHKTFHVPLLGVKHFDVEPCVPLQPLRDILKWAFAVVTAISCYFIIFKSSGI